MVTGSNRQSSGFRFRVGDRVHFPFGTRTAHGVIVEDRGNLGVGGRRIVRIEFDLDSEHPSVIEMPAEELAPDDEPVSSSATK